MATRFLLYGSYGYTGALIAEAARARGLEPILAGRNREALAAQADALGLPHRALALEDQGALETALEEVTAVLHCAGPFSRTSAPMVDACLRTKTHYLDITGEIAVFEALAKRSAEAERAGVMLLPGSGFDVVPSDCLARFLAKRLPGAQKLRLAFYGVGSRTSRGTATTMLESLHLGGAVRRGGKVVRVPAAYQTRAIDFGRGPKQAVTIPWGDVSTAFYSTGIPDIEVYTVLPARALRLLRLSRHAGGLLGSPPVQSLLTRFVQRQPPGPSEKERQNGKSLLWGEVEDDAGARAAARLTGPEAYSLTARAALHIVVKVLAGEVTPGFQTPSTAYGEDLVLELGGVEREEL